VPGIAILATAHGVTETTEALVTMRVNMETTNGPWQNTIRSRVLLFPAHAKENKQ
jgi:hypothetical protein